MYVDASKSYFDWFVTDVWMGTHEAIAGDMFLQQPLDDFGGYKHILCIYIYIYTCTHVNAYAYIYVM